MGTFSGACGVSWMTSVGMPRVLSVPSVLRSDVSQSNAVTEATASRYGPPSTYSLEFEISTNAGRRTRMLSSAARRQALHSVTTRFNSGAKIETSLDGHADFVITTSRHLC